MPVVMLEGVSGGHVFIVLSKVESFEQISDGVLILRMTSGRKLKAMANAVEFAQKWFAKAQECPFEEMSKRA